MRGREGRKSPPRGRCGAGGTLAPRLTVTPCSGTRPTFRTAIPPSLWVAPGGRQAGAAPLRGEETQLEEGDMSIQSLVQIPALCK